jgi:NitT/TauT family transport system ATP-binding protein
VKLAATGLAKRFPGGIEAISDVSIELADGEFVSIVGPSGCGKSTLLAMLAGLLAPSAGEIALDGAAPPGGLLGRVGYMPQRDLLMAWRTTLANATVGLELSGVTRAAARERALAEVGRFGLAGFEDRRPSELSGGMRQRAALLRTFLAGREVLLLDEPFGALDEITRHRLDAELLALWAAKAQDKRLTVVFVTHSLHEAVYLSQRVVMMAARPGRVLEELRIDEPYPRTPEFLVSTRFSQYARHLQQSLLRASAGYADEVP